MVEKGIVSKIDIHRMCLMAFAVCVVVNSTFGSDENMYIVSKVAMFIFFGISVLALLSKRELKVEKIFCLRYYFFS